MLLRQVTDVTVGPSDYRIVEVLGHRTMIAPSLDITESGTYKLIALKKECSSQPDYGQTWI